jgi:bifunctional DNase/RNase
LVDGVFHAKLVCEMFGEEKEIDARTSDSIALAVRFKCPIYTYEDIMESAGVVFSDDAEEEAIQQQERKNKPANDFVSLSTEQLQTQLDEAIRIEDYSKAALIRDELNKRKKK